MTDQLQALKLEISKNATLDPYERMAFHKILGISKTENGMEILLKEIGGDPIIRESAIRTLKDFNYPEVGSELLPLLKQKISADEKKNILEHLAKYGTKDIINDIIEYIENNKTNTGAAVTLPAAFKALRSVSSNSDEVNKYLKSIALNNENSDEIRAYAVIALSAFADIVEPSGTNDKSFLELILKEGSENILSAAYYSMSLLNDSITARIRANKSDEEELFTYSPEQEDRVILDIRVLIGKMTSRFEMYPNKVKIALIDAMISSNHRELLIYIMKALTSNDNNLIDMTLNLLLLNTHKLIEPDKLLRNLISLSIDSRGGNGIIIDIFVKFFSNLRDTRRNIVFMDKLYNYLVVTLETYFETYRKNFMISEVIEKDFPESFQRIRSFILNKFTPAYKKKILNFLRSSDSAMLNNMLDEIVEFIPYIDEGEESDLAHFLDMLYEKDPKSREISATRIEDINFDKRYLKDRIIRLCSIIGKLKIDNAASQLVIIYNYLKKYTDKEILDSVSYTLSMLNYSYMLGELELLLSAGDDSEQQRAVRYISLFEDQRALNIILDYLKQNPARDAEMIVTLLHSLLRQDIFGNITANSVLKEIIRENPNHEIKGLAILCLGKCAREADLSFLHEQFGLLKNNLPKEAVAQAIDHIMNRVKDINLHSVKTVLLEYIKDPDIKVRIYSCYLLLKLGSRNALNSIIDMMKIKNKQIQREIITIFAKLKSVDFSYFLISLLKEEYAISNDIIPLLQDLPDEELKEIDHFIVNIFKKYEYVGIKESSYNVGSKRHIKGLSEDEDILLDIEIPDFSRTIMNLSIIEISLLYQQLNEIVISEILSNNGILSRIVNGRITAYFKDAADAAKTTLRIYNNFKVYNDLRLPAERLVLYIQLISARIRLINEEIINLDDLRLNYRNFMPIKNRIILNKSIRDLIENDFYSQPLPDIELTNFYNNDLNELICPINFHFLSKKILKELFREIDAKAKREIELEKELKEQKQKAQSSAAISYAQALDDLGRILKDDLNDVNKYIQKRSTDRELIFNTEKMLSNIYKRFFVEKSKIFSEIE